MEPMKVFKGTRGNNNQGGKTEIIRHFLVLKKNLQDQILHKTVQFLTFEKFYSTRLLLNMIMCNNQTIDEETYMHLLKPQKQ